MLLYHCKAAGGKEKNSAGQQYTSLSCPAHPHDHYTMIIYYHFTHCIMYSMHAVASVIFDSLRPNGLLPTSLLPPWDSPGKNTEVGCHFLLQGIFLTQGLNPCLLWPFQEHSLPLSHLGNPPLCDLSLILGLLLWLSW